MACGREVRIVLDVGSGEFLAIMPELFLLAGVAAISDLGLSSVGEIVFVTGDCRAFLPELAAVAPGASFWALLRAIAVGVFGAVIFFRTTFGLGRAGF